MGSKGSSSTTSNQSYLPTGAPLFFNALNRANDASQTPYQNYNGELVAGLSPTQQAGIGQINQNSNFALPYINEAAGFARQGGQSAASDIGQFLSPYTQNVVDTTQAQFDASNKVQQSQLVGNARAQSGVGGDRLAIAQSELAKQQNLTQNPVIAGLYNQGFGTALTAAQNLRQQQSNAAYGLGSLGTSGQNAQLQGANAQLTAGGLEQGTQQAQDTAAYNQFLRQIGYPFQTSQFLTQATAGLAPSLGGTQNGATTSTPAQPSILGQIAGLGLAGAGLFGGNPLAALGGGKGATGGGKGSVSSGNIGGTGLPGYGGLYASGGAVGPHDILHHALSIADTIRRHRNGGTVMDAVRGPDGAVSVPGFAFGGEPDEAAPNLRVADAFAAANDAIRSGDFDPQGINSPGDNGFLPRAADNIPLPRPKPMIAGADDDALPPQAEPTAGFAPPSAPAQPPGLAPSEFAPALREAIAASATPRPTPGFADSPGAALLSAGLGMLASGSPFPGVAIGQGGLKGLSTLEAQRKATREEADAAAKNAAQRGSLAAHGITAEQAAQRLFQSAQEHAATLAETTRHNTTVEGLTREQRELQSLQPVKVGTDVHGADMYAVRDPQTKKLIPVDPRTGQPRPEGAAPGATTALPELPTGDAYLKTLPPEQQSIVKKLANYEISPSSLSIKGGHRERLLAAASQYNPEFDSVNYPQRAAAVKAFGAGPKGDLMRSFDVGISHLNTLDELAKALENGSPQIVNQITNKFKEQFGYTAPGNFNAAKGIVGDEIAKAIVGSRGALADREEMKTELRDAKTYPQLAGVIKTFKTLMAGQLHGLKKQYEDTTGLKNFETRLSPDTLKELQPQLEPATPAAGGPKNFKSPADVQAAVKSGALKKGDTFLDANGTLRTVP